MGTFPILKRRLCGPSIVVVAAFLSIVLIATLISRPAYVERLPEVLPALEDQIHSIGDKAKTKNPGASQKNKAWRFDSARDANSYSLDAEQCNIAFPGLFKEIERSVAMQKTLGKITSKQLNISERDRGALRGMIIDQRVCPVSNDNGNRNNNANSSALHSGGNHISQRVRRVSGAGDSARHQQGTHYIARAAAKH